MDFDHGKKHIINKPGGVILHHKDGTSESYAYGDRVPTEELADYQLANIHLFTDGTDRTEYQERPQVETNAHREAVFADGAQINSTSDPVPGNYSELSETDAAQLVLSLSSEPAIQGRILLHERVHGGGRRQVMDAGTNEGRAVADRLFAHAEAGITTFDQTGHPPADAERDLERQARAAAAARPAPQQQAPAPVPAGSGQQIPPPQS